MIIEKTESGVTIKGIQVTYGSKEIRTEVESLLDKYNSIELTNMYSVEYCKSAFHGIVAKIIYNPERVLTKPSVNIQLTEKEKEQVYLSIVVRLGFIETGTIMRAKDAKNCGKKHLIRQLGQDQKELISDLETLLKKLMLW